MADDTMEISSEHGLNLGDEDIDIDIDFTTAQADEDYVLEDANSQFGFGESIQLQPSPAQGGFDPMVDDDDGSYSMVDAAPSHESIELQMEDGVAEHFSHGQPTFDNDTDFTGEDEVGWEHQDTAEGEPVAVDTATLEQADKEIVSHRVVTSIYLPESEEPRLPTSTNTEREVQQKKDSTNSSSDYLEPAITISESKQDRADSGPTQPVDDRAVDERLEPDSRGNATHSTLDPEVVVVYQSNEYALFSTSDSDDPDSFFLSDSSITEKSLSELFSAIRQVIIQDLSEEDELCLSIQDLGVEIEENSSMTRDITFGQVITLFTTLQQNDGVKPPQPLCVVLGTRANFIKRLGFLTAGATNGKGLSQLVSLDDESDSLETEGVIEEGITEEKHSPHLAVDENGSHQGAVVAAEFDSVDADENSNRQETSPPRDDTEGPKVGDVSEAGTAEVEPRPSKQSLVTDGYDEDGDIIDYSDEEDEQTHRLETTATPTAAQSSSDGDSNNHGTDPNFLPLCHKPKTCFCSKCNDLLVAEYEAINEELRRRSISRAAGEENPEEEAEVTDLPEVQYGDPQGNSHADDGVDYDEAEEGDDAEEFKGDLVNTEDEGLSGTNGEVHDTAGHSKIFEGVLDPIDSGFQASGDGEVQSKNGSGPGERNHNHDEVDFEYDEDDSPHTLAEIGDDAHKESKTTVFSTSDDAADAEEVNVVVDTLQIEGAFAVQPVEGSQQTEHFTSKGDRVDETYDDEVGYEDEKDETVLNGQDELPVTPGLPDPHAATAKRSRTEEEGFDDAVISRGKDAKRRRS